MNTVFLDTIGMVALWDEADQWHDAAQQAYEELKRARTPVLTTTYILLECGNSAARRPFRPAVKQWREALSSSDAIIDPSSEDQTKAWAAFDRGKSGDAGIVDHVSFVVMRRLGLTRAFTNDWHFRAAGFETLF